MGMELYIDLEKALNRGKLVQRRTMVRGANGKIHYRMQWVDPKTGQPVSDKHSNQEVQPVKTQKQHIDEHIKKMSKDEKYHHIEKHGLDWKRNDHPAIDHKNAMVALKEHMYKNPHLMGAEHLPKEGGNPIPGSTDDLNSFTDKYKKHPELMYKMMKHLGVIDDATDPRTVDGEQAKADGGNGMGAIKHMRNMMALKRHLKENGHVVDEMKNHPEFGEPHGTSSAKVAEPKTTKPKAQNIAQKGGNTVDGILKATPREDLYKIMKAQGIAEGDPALDPSIEAKMRPIHHMRNMMALKKAIQGDPTILNVNPEVGGLSEDEQARIKDLKGKEKTQHEVDAFLKRASKELKLQWADNYADQEHMQKRIKSGTEHIDNMHKISALKKIIVDDPSIMEELSPEVEREELGNLKIGNKVLGKFLRQVAGLKGNNRVGDVTAGEDKGREWEFGIASFANLSEDDEGNPILSIVDAGEDGDEWNEKVYPLKDVKKFIDGLKEGKEVAVKEKDVPLHKKAPIEIWKALNEDFEGNFTKDVGDVLKREVSNMWEGAKKTSSMKALAKASIIPVTPGTLSKLFDHYKIPQTTDPIHQFNRNSDQFKQVVYGHKVTKTKEKSAMDYLEKKANGDNDTWVLHQSAKHWSPDERMEARKDFIKGNMSVHDLDKYADGKDRVVALTNHIHDSLEHVPFDLMTDVFAHGCKLNFHKTRYDGKEHIGNFHSGEQKGIWFDHGYFDAGESLMNSKTPMTHRPPNREIKIGSKTYESGYHPFSDTCAHEFAHAIDNYLSGGGNRYLSWNTNDAGRKYSGKHGNLVDTSYMASVNRSNPNKTVLITGSAKQEYLYHPDEWMSTYEGRIYNPNYFGAGASNFLDKQPDGSFRDNNFNSHSEKGLEHWSENVARMANAYNSFKQWKQDRPNETSTSIDEWAKIMHGMFQDQGYGDDHTDGSKNGNLTLKTYKADNHKGRNQDLPGFYGYAYHEMAKRHPELHQGIKDMLFRPDFQGDKNVAGMLDRSTKNDFVRKSVELIIDIEE